MMPRYSTGDDLYEEMLERPSYYGISVYRQNPCCYKDQVEASIDMSLGHFDFASDAAHKMRAAARVVEALTLRFYETGEIETVMGACEGCTDIDPRWLALEATG